MIIRTLYTFAMLTQRYFLKGCHNWRRIQSPGEDNACPSGTGVAQLWRSHLCQSNFPLVPWPHGSTTGVISNQRLQSCIFRINRYRTLGAKSLQVTPSFCPWLPIADRLSLELPIQYVPLCNKVRKYHHQKLALPWYHLFLCSDVWN